MTIANSINIAALALLPASALAAGGPSSDNAETRFMVYYGSDFSEPVMAALAESDVLVVHPGVDGMTPAVVAELQSRGVSEVLCYLSVGEDARRNPVHVGDGRGPTTHNGDSAIEENTGVASFYVDMAYDSTEGRYVRDFQPDTNAEYGSRYVFPNAQWRHLLEHQRIGGSEAYPDRNDAGVAQILGPRAAEDDTDRSANLGCDGLFMDTLGTAAPNVSEGRYAWAADEMSYTIELIRTAYPDAYLMANDVGYFFNPNSTNPDFNVRPYDFTIRPFIDAIAWESYRIDRESGAVSPYFAWHEGRFAPKIVAESMREDGFAVFTIEYAENASDAQIQETVSAVSRENGWSTYFADDVLLHGLGRHIGHLGLTVDTAPPRWDSTCSQSADRVGIQRLEPGPSFGEIIVGWDVAKDQTGPITFDVEVSQAADMSSAVLFEDVATRVGDQWSTNTSVGVAYETTIGGLPEGEYYVRVRALDGLGQREENDVVMSVLLGPKAVTNPAQGIVVDGYLDDWMDFEPLGADPDDLVEAHDNSDAIMLWMADDDGKLYVAVEVEGVYDRGELNLLFFDTDRDRFTGYDRGLGIGADYLVRGQRVYSYQGSDGIWSWRMEGTAMLGPGTHGEMMFPLRWLGSPTEFEVVYQALTTPREYAPNTGDTPGGDRYLYVVSGRDNVTVDGFTTPEPQLPPLPAPSFTTAEPRVPPLPPLPAPSFTAAEPRVPPVPPLPPVRLRALPQPPQPRCGPDGAASRGLQSCRPRR